MSTQETVLQNFTYYSPTRIFFGKGQIDVLGAQVRQFGTQVLLVSGKGSIHRNGIHAAVVAQLHSQGINIVELSGVTPNPRLGTVLHGAELCRRHGLEFVLAVGGGSVIDCAKGIAAAALCTDDPWDFWTWKTRITRALPLGTVLTLSATGSEMNSGTVITNEATAQKHGTSADVLFPKFSILDPTYTFSVPPDQTAAGVADILAHVYEFYFSPVEGATLQDNLAEALMKTCVQYGPRACAQLEDYTARANLMWAAGLALNGTVSAGKKFDGFNHLVEHAISALYDLTHGVGLAILAPHWMEYILDDSTASRFARFARNVWGVAAPDDRTAAQEGIRATRLFYTSLGLPAQLSQVDIGSERFEEIVLKSVFRDTLGSIRPLTKQDVLAILQHCA